MTDINRRFSKAQWINNGSTSGQNALVGNGYTNEISKYTNVNMNPQYNNSGISTSSTDFNSYNNRSNTSLNPNNYTSAESIHSSATNATNATSATTRRRFSVKLSQPPDLYNSLGAPPLPYNAHSQINNSFTNASDLLSVNSMDDKRSLSTIQQNNGYNISTDGLTNKNLNGTQRNQAELLNELSDENFNASKYVQSKLGDANAARIDDFSTYMETLNIANDDAVKYSLSESTTQVLLVSETFQQTHEVLSSLKPKITDLTDILSQQLEEAHEYLHNESSTSSPSNSTSALNDDNSLKLPGSKVNRQSVMLLQNKWTNAMKKLYSNIDRAHDLLPSVSTRHIIIESRRWGELNSITCKPVRPVHIVVLNDAILIASRVRDSSKYLNENDNTAMSNGLNSPKKSKTVRTIATHCWMIDKVTIQRCSEIKELNDILSNRNPNSIKTRNNSDTGDSESNADLALCIRSMESNQTFLFQTDLSTEFVRVFEAIKQAKSESSSIKRRSMRDSISKLNLSNFNNKSDSRHVSITGIPQALSTSLIEKQLEPEFKACLSMIDDLLTLSSLELGLHRYDECVGYFTRLEEEIRHMEQIAISLGIPKSLLTSKSFTESKKDGSQPSPFSQEVHLVYNLKLSSTKRLTNQLVNLLFAEIAMTDSDLDSLKGYIDIFRVLKRDKDAAEIYLESRGRELRDCISMVRVGGGSSGNNSFDLLSSKPNGLLNSDRTLSRSGSSKRLSGLLSRPTSLSVTPEPENSAEINEDNNDNMKLSSIGGGGVAGEVITSYVRELSLVYMGFITKVWDEWNESFANQNRDGSDQKSFVSNVRIFEWVNEHIEELRQAVQLALLDYERTGDVFKTSVKTMKLVFEALKEKELNVDYLLEI